uniref:hypothetical protein n=1 Tax=uncultured Dysgonomonas sp. TaxID=206096 RepID=UPI002601D0CA|nr:hypothetical protein [uncultured Dysgonomonas sp.]
MKLKQIFSFLLFTLIMGFTFTACDSDDVDSPTVSEWEFFGFNFNVETTDSSLKQTILDLLKNSSWSSVGTYTFKENGTCISRLTPWCGTGMEYPKDYFIEGTYKLKGDSIYFDGRNVAYQFFKGDSLYAYGVGNKQEIAEYLKIDVAKIIRAETVLVYKKVK